MTNPNQSQYQNHERQQVDAHIGTLLANPNVVPVETWRKLHTGINVAWAFTHQRYMTKPKHTTRANAKVHTGERPFKSPEDNIVLGLD